MIHVRPRRMVLAPGEGPHLSPEALEADWRAWWVTTGHPRQCSPDAAFLGWVRKRV